MQPEGLNCPFMHRLTKNLKFYAQKVKDNIKVLSMMKLKNIKIEFKNLKYYNISNSYNDKSIENLLEFIDVEYDEN